jgi:hypothetical protein
MAERPSSLMMHRPQEETLLKANRPFALADSQNLVVTSLLPNPSIRLRVRQSKTKKQGNPQKTK